MNSGWTQTRIVLDGFFDLLACGKCKKTPKRPIRYVTCGHFFCDTCIYGASLCYQCKMPVRPNEMQPYRTVAQLIEYCQIIRDIIAEIKPEDLRPLASAVKQFAAEHRGVVPETDSESDEEVVQSTPPDKQSEQNKNVEPETAGYIDPTQFTQRRRKTVEDPETVGYIDPTQFSPHQNNQRTPTVQNDFGPETAGYVDSTLMNKSHIEENLEPETVGYVDPTQTPRRHWKKNVQARTSGFIDRISDNQDHRKAQNSAPETASYIDPTPMSQNGRKMDLQARTKGFVESTRTSQGCKKNNVETESNEYINPTPDQRGSKISSQAETAGFVDPTPMGEGNKKNEVETESAQYIDSTPENHRTRKTNLQPKIAGYVRPTPTKNWCNHTDSVNEAATQNNVSINKSSKDLVLAPESVPMEENSSSRIVIPETLQTVEDTQDYQDSSMEMKESRKNTLSKKFTRNCEDKIPNTGHDTLAVSSLRDTRMETVEMERETPLKKLKRIKSLALERRSEIFTNCLDMSNIGQVSPMERTEVREISPKKQPKLDENLTLESQDKVSSIDADTMSIARVGNLNEETAGFVEKTSLQPRRRTKDSTVDRDTSGTASAKDFTNETLIVEEKVSTKRLSRIKDFAIERQNKNSSINDEILTNTSASDAPTKNSLMRENDAVKQLRSLENLKPQEKSSVKKCKEKLVKLKTRRSIGEKSNSTIPKAIPKNVNKRNAKGETALHTACVKGQEDYVKALLEAGANPNTKDNANWTPLQEAVNLGHREICKMLLQAGASTNTPAMDNRTALHDAAANDKLEEASLLLRFNASKDVYDKFGNKPIDYAVSDEMRVLLADENNIEEAVDDIAHLNTTLEQSIIIPNAKVVVLPSNLSNKNRKLLAQLATKLKVEVATSFRPSVTHVIVEANERNITKLTYFVMLAILQGKWILNSQWITISTDLNDISEIDLELFEVHGAPNLETPARARMNEEKQNPRLFNNCFFYFAIGPRGTWNYEKFEFSKDNLTSLVIAGQGEILNREPDPEDVKDCKLKPFHVAHKPIHPLHRCSHYIIYMPGKDEPRIKYNMPHIKTLPLGWFLECIEKFALVDPSLMGIS